MTETDEIKRKRLLFQSAHRGRKETDLLLGDFARAHIRRLTTAQLDRFEALLEHNDPDIYGWITGRDPVPAHLNTDVMNLLKDFVRRWHLR